MGEEILDLSSENLSNYNVHLPYRRGDINLHSGEKPHIIFVQNNLLLNCSFYALRACHSVLFVFILVSGNQVPRFVLTQVFNACVLCTGTQRSQVLFKVEF